MDLIYTDSGLNELGYLQGFDLDLEDSKRQHTFQLKVSRSVWPYLQPGSYIYVDGHGEYGGKITKAKHITSQNEITLEGRTWLGLLQTKTICPPWNTSHSGYLAYRSESNKTISAIVSSILTETALSSLFEVETTTGNVSFQFDRYCTVLSGFQKLYSANDLRFRCIYNSDRKKVLIRGDVSDEISTEEFSSYQYDFDISKDSEPANHIIGLGSGELAERMVCHALARLDFLETRPGEIDIFTQSQYYTLTHSGQVSISVSGTSTTVFLTDYYTGDEEIVDVYDYPNVESEADLKDGAVKRMKELRNTTSFAIDIADVDLEIGDTVSGVDEITGLSVSKAITGKILKMTEFGHTISYKTEE